MIMPANYSAIAENEMTYVDGGNVEIGSITSNPYVSTFASNIGTLIGNTFVSKLINNTLGVMFGGEYTFGGVISRISSILSNTAKNDTDDGGNATVTTEGVLNAGMKVVGGLFALTQLCLVDVSPKLSQNAYGVDGKVA